MADDPDFPIEKLLVAARGGERCDAFIQRSGSAQMESVPCKHELDVPNRIELSLLCAGSGRTRREDDGGTGLLIQAAKFADRNPFSALWLFAEDFATGAVPPLAGSSVTGAAIAVLTERVEIRGELASPMASPVRAAEEWSVIDNLSRGRAGILLARKAIAPPDAVCEGRPDDGSILHDAETLQKLWRGECVDFPGVGGTSVPVKTLPRPLQPRLPLWILVQDESDAQLAREIGAGLLMDLVKTSLKELSAIIRIYGPLSGTSSDSRFGRVAVVAPCYVGQDEMILKAATALARNAVTGSRRMVPPPQGHGRIDDGNLDAAIVSQAVAVADWEDVDARILCGTPDQCIAKMLRLRSLGVDEIACWIDFGLDNQSIRSGFPGLRRVSQRLVGGAGEFDAVASAAPQSGDAGPALLDAALLDDDTRAIDAARQRARTRRDMTTKRQRVSPSTPDANE